MADIILEMVLSVLAELGMELGADRRVPKWIRRPIAAAMTLFFALAVLAVLYAGGVMLRENTVTGVLLMAGGLLLLGGSVVLCRRFF